MASKSKLAKETPVHGEGFNSPRQFFGVFKYSKRALELLWSTSKPLSFLLGFCTILAGILPSGVAWVGARIVDSVYWATRAIANGQEMSVMPTVWWVVAEAGILVVITAAHRGITLCQALLKDLLIKDIKAWSEYVKLANIPVT